MADEDQGSSDEVVGSNIAVESLAPNPPESLARNVSWLRALQAICAAGAFGSLGSVAVLDCLSRVSTSESAYTTAASRLSFVALVPLVGALVAGLVLALAGRNGERSGPQRVSTLLVLDVALLAAVASVATRDNSSFLAHDAARWPALLLGLAAAAAAGLGATSLFLAGPNSTDGSDV